MERLKWSDMFRNGDYNDDGNDDDDENDDGLMTVLHVSCNTPFS